MCLCYNTQLRQRGGPVLLQVSVADSETLTQGLLTKEDVPALNTSPPACIIKCYRDAVVHYAWATARNYQQEMVATSRHKKGPQWRSIKLIQK